MSWLRCRSSIFCIYKLNRKLSVYVNIWSYGSYSVAPVTSWEAGGVKPLSNVLSPTPSRQKKKIGKKTGEKNVQNAKFVQDLPNSHYQTTDCKHLNGIINFLTCVLKTKENVRWNSRCQREIESAIFCNLTDILSKRLYVRSQPIVALCVDSVNTTCLPQLQPFGPLSPSPSPWMILSTPPVMPKNVEVCMFEPWRAILLGLILFQENQLSLANVDFLFFIVLA